MVTRTAINRDLDNFLRLNTNRRGVHRLMFSYGGQNQIVRRIIVSHFILVVDYFLFGEGASDYTFHYHAVLKAPFPVYRYVDVSALADKATSLPCGITRTKHSKALTAVGFQFPFAHLGICLHSMPSSRAPAYFLPKRRLYASGPRPPQ